MSYLATMTTMLSEAKDTIHERHIIEQELMMRQMIEELTPQIVKQELATMDSELLVKIQTQLNGKDMDFPEIRIIIRQMIEEELKTALNRIRI